MKMKNGKWPQKAYKNLEFLNSPDARTVRILAEFLEPAARFRKYRIKDTIVIFGSARTNEPSVAKDRLNKLEKSLRGKKISQKEKSELKSARTAVKMSRYYEDSRRLARLLTEWSISLGRGKRRFIVSSGGGPGIMEAANRGAGEHPKGYTIGLNISLPLEQSANPYITPDLNFEFHYFFIRKYWFLYMAKALVFFPGGFGTLDELFEVLTLVQTKKLAKPLPVVIYGKSFWKKLINFDHLVEMGNISSEDLGLFNLCDDPEEAFTYLKEKLSSIYLSEH